MTSKKKKKHPTQLSNKDLRKISGGRRLSWKQKNKIRGAHGRLGKHRQRQLDDDIRHYSTFSMNRTDESLHDSVFRHMRVLTKWAELTDGRLDDEIQRVLYPGPQREV